MNNIFKLKKKIAKIENYWYSLLKYLISYTIIRIFQKKKLFI